MLAERDERVRRYLDGELTPEERKAFENQLSADPDLQEEVHALEHLITEARSLPPYRAPENLRARISGRLKPKVSRQRRESYFRRAPLIWVPVMAAGVLVTLAFLLSRSNRNLLWSPADNLQTKAMVTFQIRAPGAKLVSVVGDFNQWQIGSVPLEDPEGDGVWTVKVQIPYGRHHYQFVIDGERWLPDPEAPVRVDDGFGNKNSVLEVAVTDRHRGRLT